MNTKLIYIFLLLIFCAPPKPYQLKNVFLNSDALSDLRAKRVAVLNFEPSGEVSSAAGKKVADEFNLQLGKIGKFDLVERARIEELYKEQDLDPKRIDRETGVRIGKMLGAHGVILGSVNYYEPGKVGVSTRLVSVETGEIIWQGSDILYGNDKRVQILLDERADREKLTYDEDYLAQLLCRLLAETLK